MVIFAKPEVLGQGQWDTVSDWKTTADANGMYSATCLLSDGERSCGVPTFETDPQGKENMVFTNELIQGSRTRRSVRNRAYSKHNEVSLPDGITISTSSDGVDIKFKCWYLTTVTVDSEDYNVQTITLTGEETNYANTGNLAHGFTLVISPATIILGQVAEVTATWAVAISAVSFHFDSCKIIHGSQSVNIIQGACTASSLGVTTPANGVYQFRTFRITGAEEKTGTAQRMSCDIKICRGSTNCARTGSCPTTAGYGFV